MLKATLKIFIFFIFIYSGNFAQSNISDNPSGILGTDKILKLLSPNGGEHWAVGSFPLVNWESNNISLIKIELSLDDGSNWEVISPATAANSSPFKKWRVPDTHISELCRIKISQFDSLGNFHESEQVFNIVDSLSVEKIVVLGSSTAAGTGPTSSDSAWVNRYRNYILGKNSVAKVINLAVGGYTTYELMPDDFIPSAGKPSPSVGHNITQAISFQPRAIIINLPSNDATKGFGVDEQIANYDTMLARASAANIPVWVATTQPRNLSEDKIQIQKDMRDSTYTHFGNFAIDFWTDIALDNGKIDSTYNSGDGVHLNNAGHRILFERVRDANIYEQTILPTSIDEIVNQIPTEFVLEQNYPNPFNPSTKIKFIISNSKFGDGQLANVILKVYDILGREISTLVNEIKSPGVYEISFDAGNLSSGTYFYILSTGNYFESKKMILLK
ncbi:MAG: GDSL-type esterase/lipase family protein [Melioribacteraceae bacterium]